MNKEDKLKLIAKMATFITHRNSSEYSIMGEHMAGCALDAIQEAGYELVAHEPCPNCEKPLLAQKGGGIACSDAKNCGYWFCY